MRSKSNIRFGVVTAWPDEDWHSERLLGACARRGYAVAVDPAELAAFVEENALDVRALSSVAESFDALILARGFGRSGDADVQFEIYRALEAAGALVVNRIDALLAAQDKFRSSWMLKHAGVTTPRAAVAQTPRSALEALASMGDAVMKPLSGSLGEGVERVAPDQAGRRAVLARVESDGAIYLQSFVPSNGTDIRVFVVGGFAIAAIERIAPPGEWRTNIYQGAEARPFAMSEQIKQLARRASRIIGLDYAGIDVIVGPNGPTVIEANGNPGWDSILDVTGEDMAEPIVEHVLARALHRRNGQYAQAESLKRRVSYG